MHVVILAAGKGTRLGKITQKTPKSLAKVAGKPIIEYTLSSLPDKIKRVHIVVGHLGDRIVAHLGNKYGRLEINYIWQKKPLGTGHILKLIKPFINDRFLIINGDDIYSKKELEKMLEHPRAFGLAKKVPEHSKYLSIKLGKGKKITGAGYPTLIELKKGALLATGAYVLDKNIFKYKPVKLLNGEYGLPQTILKSVKKLKIKGILMKNWLQINLPADIKKAERILSLK